MVSQTTLLLAPRAVALVLIVGLGLARTTRERLGHVLIPVSLLLLNLFGVRTLVFPDRGLNDPLILSIQLFLFPELLLALLVALLLWRPSVHRERLTWPQRWGVGAIYLVGLGWGAVTLGMG